MDHIEARRYTFLRIMSGMRATDDYFDRGVNFLHNPQNIDSLRELGGKAGDTHEVEGAIHTGTDVALPANTKVISIEKIGFGEFRFGQRVVLIVQIHRIKAQTLACGGEIKNA